MDRKREPVDVMANLTFRRERGMKATWLVWKAETLLPVHHEWHDVEQTSVRRRLLLSPAQCRPWELEQNRGIYLRKLHILRLRNSLKSKFSENSQDLWNVGEISLSNTDRMSLKWGTQISNSETRIPELLKCTVDT